MKKPPFASYKDAYIYKIIELYEKVINKNTILKASYFRSGEDNCWFHPGLERADFQDLYIDDLAKNRAGFERILNNQNEANLNSFQSELESRVRALELNYDSSIGGLVIELESDNWANVDECQFEGFMSELDKIYQEECSWATRWYHKLDDGTYWNNLENAKMEYDSFGEFKKVAVVKATEPDYWERTVNYLIEGDAGEDFTFLGLGIQIILGISGLDAPMDIRDLIANIKKKNVGGAILCGIGLIPLIGLLKNLKYLDEGAELIEQAGKHGPEALEQLKVLANSSDEIKQALGNTEELQDTIVKLQNAGTNIADNADPQLMSLLKKFPEQLDEIQDFLKNGDEFTDVAKRVEILENLSASVSSTTNFNEVANIIGKRIDDVELPKGYISYIRKFDGKKIIRRFTADNAEFVRLVVDDDGLVVVNKVTQKYVRNVAERRRFLMSLIDDSSMSDEIKNFIRNSKGNNVPEGFEVSHKQPLYTKPIEERHTLDTMRNMELIPKDEHRLLHMFCGDTYHDWLPTNYR